MRRQSIFNMLDLIIYFNIILFVGGSISALKQSTVLGIIFIVIGLLNLLFMLLTIKLRLNYNKNLDDKIQNDAEAEELLSDESRFNFKKSKQLFLESRIEAEIKDKIPGAKIIRNAYIPKSNGDDSEIDVLVISEQGIFVIEGKNITGRIIGNWKDDKLEVKHPGGKSYELTNPINQNSTHYLHLKNILGLKNDLFRSVIVFGDSATIESFKEVPYFSQVCYIHNLIFSINKLAKRFDTKLKQYEIDNIYNNLIEFTSKTEEREQKHIARITKT